MYFHERTVIFFYFKRASVFIIPILVIFRKEKEDAETKLESEKQERIELEEQICNLQVR